MDPIADDLVTELDCYKKALSPKDFCPWNITHCWDTEITLTDSEFHQDFLAECNTIAFCAENVTIQGNRYNVFKFPEDGMIGLEYKFSLPAFLLKVDYNDF